MVCLESHVLSQGSGLELSHLWGPQGHTWRASTCHWAGPALTLQNSVTLLVARVMLSSGPQEPGWKIQTCRGNWEGQTSRPRGQSGLGHYLSVLLCLLKKLSFCLLGFAGSSWLRARAF